MTLELPHKSVAMRINERIRPLAPHEKQALDSVQDPQLRQVLAETIHSSRRAQANLERIAMQFPIQPENAAEDIRGDFTLPFDSLGDLLVGDEDTGGVLPVGEDGQVLVADSSSPLGVKWGDAEGGEEEAPESVIEAVEPEAAESKILTPPTGARALLVHSFGVNATGRSDTLKWRGASLTTILSASGSSFGYLGAFIDNVGSTPGELSWKNPASGSIPCYLRPIWIIAGSAVSANGGYTSGTPKRAAKLEAEGQATGTGFAYLLVMRDGADLPTKREGGSVVELFDVPHNKTSPYDVTHIEEWLVPLAAMESKQTIATVEFESELPSSPTELGGAIRGGGLKW